MALNASKLYFDVKSFPAWYWRKGLVLWYPDFVTA